MIFTAVDFFLHLIGVLSGYFLHRPEIRTRKNEMVLIIVIIKNENLIKTWKVFLLIVVLAAITFLMIKSVEQHYHAGKQAATGALIGQVMREMKGADPAQVRQMLVERLEADRPRG